ncbi:S6 family peptidase [Escherichia coli]|uniref:S6 family peptidase n=1 Tax=Escherichia coli TaxID=562 RepID=UPI00202BA9BF|nr:autotransporter outer membrane beta-barrel domain-containing protein [Escherichia coli]
MKITVLNQRYKKHFGYPHILMGDVKVTVSAMIACAVLLHPNKLFASVAGTSLPYQTYRDFAENKGEFRPGAENVPLYDKNGNPVTTLNKAPMIDFSSNDSTGVATLVSPQYVVSVKHNVGYQYVKFGYADDSSYALVDRNNHWRDFHTPRLNKIVTEVTPLDITNAGTAKGTYQNADRFPVFYRVGTGTQYVKDTNGKITYLMGAYSYKTGGIVNTPAISDWSFVTNTTNTPLSTYGTPGDSGSPLFAWGFTQSSLSLGEGAKLTATAGLLSDGTVSSNAGASLSLLSDQPGTMYSAQSWELSGQDTSLNVGAGGIITGDINANDAASISFGTTDINQSTNYYGNINAPLASVTMKDTAWQVNKQSVAKSLTLNGSTLSFNRFGQGGLTSDTLEATNSSFIINADGKAADTVTVNQALTGGNNTLVVIPTTNSVKQGGDPVSLVTAPKNTQSNIFTLNPVSINAGFHSFTPQLDVLETDVNKQWRLEGFYIQPDKAALRTGKSFMDLGYKNFITEINNLNDRMGDLRHTHGETGAWARLNSGSGSATDGFTGSYTHLQIGADRKHIIEGGELFTGVTATFTSSNNRGTGWSGRTKSTGIGVYASAMFDSGLYVDTIGKYVRHDNHYSSSALGMPEQDYGSHSWYLGAEAGWRFSLPDETYIQPQTELIYGTVSENQFAWQFNGGEIYMQRKQMQPLIGRTGIEFGKTFRGKDWEMTALTGINYQYDLFKPTVTAFKDLAGDTYINNGKDSRVVFNVGVNTKIKENTRISLNVERSEFGSYNIDKLINANIRYTF